MEIKELLLREIGKFKNNKIIFSNYHVSTDNMNKHNQPIFYSKKGNLYEKTNILMSNIRPYFNKVWYSDRTGSKSSNVLCFVVTNNNVLSKYAYYLICSDKFNNFWSKTSKGTTMPVGDKEAILNFKFKICDKVNQQAIINIIEPKEDLFLKYHKVVDITTLETFTSSWANLINIIEPFEKMECKYKAKIDYILKIGDFKILNIFSTKYFLKDFFNVEIGQTPSTKNKSYWKDGENFWINSGALTNNLVLLNATNKITQNAVKSKNLKKSNKYSTFISIMEPSINKISLSGISSYFNQSIANIEPINKNDYGFIFFELRRNIYKLSSLSTGTAQKSINKSDLLNFKINRPIDDNLLFFKLSKLLINHHNIIFHCKKIINLITSLLII